MKRILLFCVATVILLSGTASATLTVEEFNAGEKVTYDDATGQYWYYDLARFNDMTYNEQINEISGLGTYGKIAGGWHLATFDEMTALWSYAGETIGNNFALTGYGAPSWDAEIWRGRFEWIPPNSPGFHGTAGVYHMASGAYDMNILGDFTMHDLTILPAMGAWVTTDAIPIPVPPAILLGSIGVGFISWLRRRKTI